MNTKDFKNQFAAAEAEEARILAEYIQSNIPFEKGEKVKLISKKGKENMAIYKDISYAGWSGNELNLRFRHINKDGKISKKIDYSFDFEKAISVETGKEVILNKPFS